MNDYPDIIVTKAELAGIPSRNLFAHIRKITAERGLVYSKPPYEGRLFKGYLPIQVVVKPGCYVYRNVDEEVLSRGKES